MTKNIINQEYNKFLSDLKERVASSRYKAALSVNKELILLYHHIGTQILEAQNEAGWGAKVIDQLSKDLASEFPEMKGFSTRNLKYMRKFAEEYPDAQFVQEALAQLPWGHIVTLLDKISDKQIRLFYVKHAIEHGWSRNIMVMQMELSLHKRQGQAITNFKDKLPSPQSDLAHYTLKDPYIFDFLSIGDEAHEREVEKALVHIWKNLSSSLERDLPYDFCVKSENLWQSVGHELIEETKAAAKVKGASQIIVVCGAHDLPKRKFLNEQNLQVVSEWFIGGIV